MFQNFREPQSTEAFGFVEASQKGSHVKFVRHCLEGVATAIVPRKREVPVGPLRSILNQPHIDPED
jgi:predicted RNA binding protein YcfA (HicA-like mRNA interferase family)